jgi:hypothetical protein
MGYEESGIICPIVQHFKRCDLEIAKLEGELLIYRLVVVLYAA